VTDGEHASTKLEMNERSFDSFGQANSYDGEPWVLKYAKQNIFRKIFSPEVGIQDPGLRQIHDTMFAQGLLLGALIAAILEGIFLAVPKGNFF
jgi:hypothetical protein